MTTTLMLRHHAYCVRWASTVQATRRDVTTAIRVRLTGIVIRPPPVRRVRRASTRLVMRHRVQIALEVVRTSTEMRLLRAMCATTVSTRHLGRLYALSVGRTRWTMTLIHRHRAWIVWLATCRIQVRSCAVRVQSDSCTMPPLRVQEYARRVRWVSTRTCLPKARASIVLLANMQMLLGRAAAQTACPASTRLLLGCGSVICAGWVGTLPSAHPHAQCARQAVVMWTVTRPHHVLVVKLASTRVLSGRTARRVWLVEPILTAILRQSAMAVVRATMLRPV